MENKYQYPLGALLAPAKFGTKNYQQFLTEEKILVMMQIILNLMKPNSPCSDERFFYKKLARIGLQTRKWLWKTKN
jgi:hypothetical protein